MTKHMTYCHIMGKVVNISEAKTKNKNDVCLTNYEAQVLINELAEKTSNIIIPVGQHGSERIIQRGFTRADVVHILRNGVIAEEPRKSGKRWKYKLELIGYQGKGAAVVTLIMKNNKLLVATAMWTNKRS